jgi:hypothetical protein
MTKFPGAFFSRGTVDHLANALQNGAGGFGFFAYHLGGAGAARRGDVEQVPAADDDGAARLPLRPCAVRRAGRAANAMLRG